MHFVAEIRYQNRLRLRLHEILARIPSIVIATRHYQRLIPQEITQKKTQAIVAQNVPPLLKPLQHVFC